jgi:type VI secretion system secreted protein Hcp
VNKRIERISFPSSSRFRYLHYEGGRHRGPAGEQESPPTRHPSFLGAAETGGKQKGLAMKSKLPVGVLLVALVVAGVATFSWAASTDAQTINACANADGRLRLVPAVDQCKKGESPVSWNTVGPAGPQGLTGPQGPAGPSAGNPPDPDAVAGTVNITSTKHGAFGTIVLTGLTHEISSPRDPASGLPTGKRQHKPITITKEFDRTTPLLLSALVTNETLTSVLIGLERNGQQFATIKLTNASASNYVTHGLTEKWSFTYQKIEWDWLGNGGVSAEDDWESPVS